MCQEVPSRLLSSQPSGPNISLPLLQLELRRNRIPAATKLSLWFSLALGILAVLVCPVLGQPLPGSLDPSFAPEITGGLGIESIAVQSNGKIVVTGDFTTVNGVPRLGLARLNPDGTLDQTFATPTIIIQPSTFDSALGLPGDKLLVSGFAIDENLPSGG